MKNKTITLVSFLGLSLSTFSIATSSHAEIYKWTDAKGQVHYSARPPVQKQENTQEIEDKILMSVGKFNPSSVKNTKTSTEAPAEDDVLAENTENKDANNKPTKQLVDYCKTQRKNLKLLKNNKDIMWEQFGKKTSLSTAQRKAKIKKIKTEITEECKGI